MKYFRDYTEFDAEKEVLRQTERHLEDQQRLTSSADQRAVAFAAVQMVVIGILLGNDTAKSIEASRVAVVSLLIVSVSFAIYSAKPTRVYGSGSNANALDNYRISPSHGYLLATLIDRNERNIQHNDSVLKRSAGVFRVALLASLLSVAIMMVDWMDLLEMVSGFWEKRK